MMDKKNLAKLAVGNGLHSSDVASGWLEKYVARYKDRFLVVGVESDRDCDPPWETGDLAAPLHPRRDRAILAHLQGLEDGCEVYFGRGGGVYAAAGEGWFALPSESAIYSGLSQGEACEKAKDLASQGANSVAAFEEFGCLAWFARPAVVAQERLAWLGGWSECGGGYEVASPSALVSAIRFVKEAIAEILTPVAFSGAGEWDADAEEFFRDWEKIEIK